MNEDKIEPYYQLQAKHIVDSMFDAKMFVERLTRDDIQSLEDLIAYYMQSHANSERKLVEIMNKIEKTKKCPSA